MRAHRNFRGLARHTPLPRAAAGSLSPHLPLPGGGKAEEKQAFQRFPGTSEPTASAEPQPRPSGNPPCHIYSYTSPLSGLRLGLVSTAKTSSRSTAEQHGQLCNEGSRNHRQQPPRIGKWPLIVPLRPPPILSILPVDGAVFRLGRPLRSVCSRRSSESRSAGMNLRSGESGPKGAGSSGAASWRPGRVVRNGPSPQDLGGFRAIGFLNLAQRRAEPLTEGCKAQMMDLLQQN